MHVLIMLFSILLSVTGCSSITTRLIGAEKTPPEPTADLSRDEARERKARLRDIHYEVHVKLTEADPEFNGTAHLDFMLQDTGRPLRIDFFEGKVSAISVNAQEVGVEAKKQYWIEIPATVLKEGRNSVKIVYSAPYSRQGQGLHRFVDPETHEVFLYSQFETYDANRFMPCFDQPDLRATLDLTVEAPARWEVISTTAESQVTKAAEDGRRTWTFERTPPLATYVFSLHAGPYKIWRDTFKGIPLRLFARPSMASYVRPQEWFKITKQGLQFFSGYFNHDYPFKKYDQLFVPEFNAGAMENVGAVTFSEVFLVRGEVTRQQRRKAAEVLLHEMAHMWFGDLVTMKWWNDLWLNESFATFMASLALSKATEFNEAWQDFRLSAKSWAYWEDGLPTTHPIEAEVPSVKTAFANFDGITYGKGAAVLKQLNFHLGQDRFTHGIRDYIRVHAFRNAELKDFIESLQKHATKNVTQWADMWLRQPGTDRLGARWECNNGKLDKVHLHFTPAAGTRFRPQTVWLGLFKDDRGRAKELQTLKVDLQGTDQDVRVASACPQLVYPNHRDEGYIHVELDEKSLEYARRSLSSMSDPLLRTMMWADLWEMVRNGSLSLKSYVSIVTQHFPKEQDTLVLELIVRTISGPRNEEATVLRYWPTVEKSEKERSVFIGQMENQYLLRMQSAKPGSDEQKLWFDNYVSLARSPQALHQLAKWAGQTEVLPGFSLDVDRRWSLVKRLSRFQHPEAETRLAELSKLDASERGQRNVLAAEAVLPKIEIKQKWISALKVEKPNMSFAEARSVLSALFPVEQKGLTKLFSQDFYNYLEAHGRSENEIFVESVAGTLAPLNCEATESKRLREFLKGGHLAPTIDKRLRIELDEDERCQKIRSTSML
jgi:aminopeptidase N